MDYTDKKDVSAVAETLVKLDTVNSIIMAAYVVSEGLMVPRGFTAKLLWTAVKIGSFLHGDDPSLRYAKMLSAKPEGALMAKATCLQTANWIYKGKDTTDPKSAGGFNKEEFGKIVNLLNDLAKL